ncbi:hypothetical protein [Campylobacter concisus]|uniref:hypothetical protein n=1 Tax=Campylobacter concisus TaxID=199 RepID=UPI00122CAD9A|nr:hypothetical protein [Campylobacter concisus]
MLNKIIRIFKMWLIRRHIEDKQITLRYNGEIDVRVNGLALNEGFGQRLRELSKKLLGFEIDGFKISEFDKIYDNRDALLKGLDEELKKDEFFNEDFIKNHEAAKQELENLKDIIKKLTFDLIGKCKELGIDYKDLIAQSK